MQKLFVVVAATLTLAACNQPSGTTTITSNAETGTTTTTTTGNAPSAAAMGIQPGKWQTTVDVVDSKTSGMPAGIPAPPKPAPTTITACVTPEQAARNPGELLKNAKLDCTIRNSMFSGGKVASEATCKLPNGSMSMRTTGSYTPTELSYDTEQTMKMGPITATQRMHTVSRRVGDCG
jgi:hypothetical protein